MSEREDFEAWVYGHYCSLQVASWNRDYYGHAPTAAAWAAWQARAARGLASLATVPAAPQGQGQRPNPARNQGATTTEPKPYGLDAEKSTCWCCHGRGFVDDYDGLRWSFPPCPECKTPLPAQPSAAREDTASNARPASEDKLLEAAEALVTEIGRQVDLEPHTVGVVVPVGILDNLRRALRSAAATTREGAQARDASAARGAKGGVVTDPATVEVVLAEMEARAAKGPVPTLLKDGVMYVAYLDFVEATGAVQRLVAALRHAIGCVLFDHHDDDAVKAMFESEIVAFLRGTTAAAPSPPADGGAK